ncbi:IS110 family transposase, partial [Leuconostoc citreum]|nr:IS110 family transposase [Leuconostoc citreum]MCT3074074.1 IS110 family transposase [Leuconostoc citreum]MCT4389645.1 IS110 family transposase [Leuconostoc falkenbergense]
MVMAASDCFNQLFFGGALMHAVIGIDVSKATSQVAVAVDGKVV